MLCNAMRAISALFLLLILVSAGCASSSPTVHPKGTSTVMFDVQGDVYWELFNAPDLQVQMVKIGEGVQDTYYANRYPPSYSETVDVPTGEYYITPVKPTGYDVTPSSYYVEVVSTTLVIGDIDFWVSAE
jgi:hypothetical protein